jgi:hypothetical protein
MTRNTASGLRAALARCGMLSDTSGQKYQAVVTVRVQREPPHLQHRNPLPVKGVRVFWRFGGVALHHLTRVRPPQADAV